MDYSVEIGSLLAAVIAAWTIPWKISRDIRKEREAEAAKVLQAAKEADSKIKAEMVAKVELLEVEFKNLKHEVDKDFAHLRETYNGALANLGQKIEELRTELRNQHGQLVSLLSEMIKKQ